MDRFDKIRQAMQLLGEALPGERWLEAVEERAINRASQIEKENRAQALLPFGRERAAAALECSPRNAYYLAEKARMREIIERDRQKVATEAA